MRSLKNNNFNRRIFLGSSAYTLMMPLSAFAMTTDQATDLVVRAVSEINKVISSGKNEQSMMRGFEDIFDSFGDVNMIARYALGREARSLPDADIKSFTKAFKIYVSHKYGSRFREFIGGQIDVKSSRKVKQFFEVKAKAVIKKPKAFGTHLLSIGQVRRTVIFQYLCRRYKFTFDRKK
jgi:phospholipid transport system substrate-binding protein